eukprot:c296_g1_i1 orf=14-802(+)
MPQKDRTHNTSLPLQKSAQGFSSKESCSCCARRRLASAKHRHRMSSGGSKGAPKHQNKTAWKANAGIKKNDRELGGKLHPYPEITGVCPRCKAQIEWRRKYGKYKAIVEPAKCNQCSKRAVRQAYHALCSACARERNVCAKCCQPSERIVGKDADKEKEQQQLLEQALRNLRERDRRTLLRAMSNGTSKEDLTKQQITKEEKSKDKRTVEEDSELEDDEDWGSRCSEGGCDSSDADEDVCHEEKQVEESLPEKCGLKHLAIS